VSHLTVCDWRERRYFSRTLERLSTFINVRLEVITAATSGNNRFTFCDNCFCGQVSIKEQAQWFAAVFPHQNSAPSAARSLAPQTSRLSLPEFIQRVLPLVPMLCKSFDSAVRLRWLLGRVDAHYFLFLLSLFEMNRRWFCHRPARRWSKLLNLNLEFAPRRKRTFGLSLIVCCSERKSNTA